MTAAYEMTERDLIADLEDRIVKYLEKKRGKRAKAGDLVQAIRKQQAFLSTSPIVTAIWDLSAQSRVRIDDKWNVTLREPATRR